MNLNTSEWKTFLLHKIFKINYGNKFDNNKMNHDNPTVNFVSRTANNNGVNDVVDYIDGVVPFSAGDITVALGGSIGTCSIQTKPFYTAQNVAVLKNDSLSLETKLFIIHLVQKESDTKYCAFGRELNKHIKNDFDILLPICYEPEPLDDDTTIYKVDADGNKIPVFDKKHKYSTEGYVPDFQFMENYIKSLHSKPITTGVGGGVSSSVLSDCKLELEVDKWKNFALGKLFDIRKGKRLTSNDQEAGANNYIGAIDSNNGVSNHIAQKPIHDGNTISVSYNGSVGEAFYQKYPYWATDDVNAFYPLFDDFNEYIGLFIATIIRQEKYRFSYGRKWSLESMKISEVKLPIQRMAGGIPLIDSSQKYSDEGYVPDFEWMENYIKQMPYSDRIQT